MKKLDKYNKKRNFNKTKEPKGKRTKTSKKLIFVVQHHLASRDHYDLRLEWDGVLKSWAVPKGPSYNIKDKRLAVMVEDHPYEYKNFEGIIPEGEYGAGEVMIWDYGEWEPTYKPNFVHGPIKFILKGKRLKGTWSLIHFKEDNWLLIKENDGISLFKNIDEFNTSVKSGRTMEEIKYDVDKSEGNNKIFGVEITNPDKSILSRPKVTKLDIILYYSKVAELMMPFIKNRIISIIRCPSGDIKECFFKKHLETKSSGIGRIDIKKENEIIEDYYYIKNKKGLIAETQMNSYEFHIWGSTVKNIENPDIMVFDLDPHEKISIKKLREGVKDLKSILDEFDLKSYLKTSGGKGYHVVVPFPKKTNWEHFREIAKNIALLMEAKWPNKYTSNIRKKERKNKIFIDWIRNTKEATSVAPYSIRLRKRISVSMPIDWNELDTVKPNEITMEEALRRINFKNPWEDFFQN